MLFWAIGNLGWGEKCCGLVGFVALVDVERSFAFVGAGFLDALCDEFFQASELKAGRDGKFLDHDFFLWFTGSVHKS